jgi:hypothetical protein
LTVRLNGGLRLSNGKSIKIVEAFPIQTRDAFCVAIATPGLDEARRVADVPYLVAYQTFQDVPNPVVLQLWNRRQLGAITE